MSAVQEQTCTWPGKTGAQYKYWVHSLPTTFNPGQDGNYIYSKLTNGYWVPIYVGEGYLGDRISSNHHQAICIRNKGATHVHVHTNATLAARQREESDILANFPQAYTPVGCNVKPGG